MPELYSVTDTGGGNCAAGRTDTTMSSPPSCSNIICKIMCQSACVCVRACTSAWPHHSYCTRLSGVCGISVLPCPCVVPCTFGRDSVHDLGILKGKKRRPRPCLRSKTVLHQKKKLPTVIEQRETAANRAKLVQPLP